MRRSIAVVGVAVVAAGCLVQGLELVSPADGAQVTSPVTFRWIEPDGTDADEPWRFELSVWRSDGTLAWFAPTEDTSVSVALSPGAYTWSVRAMSDDSDERQTGAWSFTVVP